MKRVIQQALLVLVFASASAAFAVDFGLVLAPEWEYVSDTAGRGHGFTAGITPWFSAAPGEGANLYLSGKLTLEYEYETQKWADPFLAELERAELTLNPARGFTVSLGRQFYRDEGGMIASGLFDGLSAGFGLGPARVFLGGFYTGFQYKESAEILMTAEDRVRYALPLDYEDMDTYFASRRVLIPVTLEFPGLLSRLSLSVSGLAQIDINDNEENEEPDTALHTQYLEACLDIEALDSLRLGLAGIGERVDAEGLEAKRSFAAAFTLEWDLPGSPRDMLGLEARWGSGVSGGKTVAFTPVSTVAQGRIFDCGLSGLMNARAFYTLRPHESLSFSLGAIAFWRTDLETFTDPELDGASEERYLGTEGYANLIWSPDSALRFTAGGGAFAPGKAFAGDSDPRWEIRAGLIISL
jgi:hypothetical protein